jgi:hypothetical protein
MMYGTKLNLPKFHEAYRPSVLIEMLLVAQADRRYFLVGSFYAPEWTQNDICSANRYRNRKGQVRHCTIQ